MAVGRLTALTLLLLAVKHAHSQICDADTCAALLLLVEVVLTFSHAGLARGMGRATPMTRARAREPGRLMIALRLNWDPSVADVATRVPPVLRGRRRQSIIP